PHTALYHLSLHDALPISVEGDARKRTVIKCPFELVHMTGFTERHVHVAMEEGGAHSSAGLQIGIVRKNIVRPKLFFFCIGAHAPDRKSTRLNSSHRTISY